MWITKVLTYPEVMLHLKVYYQLTIRIANKR